MTQETYSDQIQNNSNRRNQILAASLRIGFVIIVWLTMAIPRQPSWVVSQSTYFHLACLITLVWSGVVFLAYFKKIYVSFFTIVALVMDMVLITVLILFSGGTDSPFFFLYLIEISATFLFGNFRQGLVVSVTAFLFYLAANVVLMMGVMPEFTTFSPNVPMADNLVLSGTILAFLIIFIVYSILVNAFLSGRVARINSRNAILNIELEKVKNEMVECFHNSEATSDKIQEADIKLNKARSQLIWSDKLFSVGRLSAGIIHEFNNPLTSIINDIEMLMMSKREGVGAVENETYKRLLYNASRIQSLVKNLKDTIGHGHSNLFVQVDVNSLIKRVISFLKLEAARRLVKIVPELSVDPILIAGLSSQLEHLIITLLTTSLDTISGENRRIVISTVLEDGNMILTIADNGRGIAAKYLDPKFDPFIDTAGYSEGYGLGLYLAREIIKDHGGKFVVDTEAGAGTAFTISLPLVENK